MFVHLVQKTAKFLSSKIILEILDLLIYKEQWKQFFRKSGENIPIFSRLLHLRNLFPFVANSDVCCENGLSLFVGFYSFFAHCTANLFVGFYWYVFRFLSVRPVYINTNCGAFSWWPQLKKDELIKRWRQTFRISESLWTKVSGCFPHVPVMRILKMFSSLHG